MKLNSIWRARMNFLRWPILCTALYRNPIQASNFSGTFDQLCLGIFQAVFTQDGPPFSISWCKRVKMKKTKNSNQEGSCLLFFLFESSWKMWKRTPLLCARAVVNTSETEKMSKKAPCFVEFKFYWITTDKNGFCRMKEEGQIYKEGLRFSIFVLGFSYSRSNFEW